LSNLVVNKIKRVMKKIVFLLTCILLAATACEKNNEPDKVFRLDPDAKIFVKASTDQLKSLDKASPEHLTPLEVVKQATVLMGYNFDIAPQSPITWAWVGKDTVSAEPALLRWGTDVIYDTDGYGNYGLQTEFINSVDLVICSGGMVDGLPKYDTLAYIPNANMANAKEAILEALEARDTTSVYGIFKDAFKFIPITGAEWRTLRAQGLN